MGFRINTNIAAMDSHAKAKRTNLSMNNSLEKLSSGLRINKAADDSSGMAIADSLKQQAKGLGQAINNANDGIGVVQTADGALEEYINIINTVRTKAIQAASDGQSAASRRAIQNDVTKLLEEAQNIATTTSFNGQTLLNGAFGNKSFHIGAYQGETVQIDIGDTRTNHVGKFATQLGGKVASGAMSAPVTVQVTVGSNGTAAGSKVAFNVSISAARFGDNNSSYDNTKIIVDEINANAQTSGVSIRASVVELSASTNASPQYGIRLDSEYAFQVNNQVGTGLDTTEHTADLEFNVSKIDVTTREAAERAIVTTGYALKELDEIRSQIGSVQNQLNSTVNNITVTSVNVSSAESQIRDVDFASESAEFNRTNILAQSGVYAMSQANSVQQNVMRLLQ